MVVIVSMAEKCILVYFTSCEAAEGYSASHWHLYLKMRQDIILN